MAKRELSCFLCREMLYEFVSGQLDDRRREAVREHLSSCDECPKERDTIQAGYDYSQKLCDTVLTDELTAQLSSEAKPLRNFLAQLRHQRVTTSFRWAAEAVVITALAAVLFNWGSQKYLLKQDKASEVDENIVIGEEKKGPDEAELAGEATPTTQGPGPGEVEIPVPTPEGTAVASATVAQPVVPTATAVVPIPTPTPVVTPPPKVAAVVDSTTEKKGKGWLYRVILPTEYLDQVTPEVVAKLEALQAKKAGKVPLGWRKGSEAYFHFTLPEAQQEELSKFLKSYGSVTISKDPHPRVMPPGTLRYILRILGSGAGGSVEPEGSPAGEQ